MPTIEARVEHERGCGWRQEGGKYLVGGSLIAPCRRLPVLLDVCPVCHAGIKPTRGWTWVDPAALQGLDSVEGCGLSYCDQCPLSGAMKRVGLLWIGEKFYNRPSDFIYEAKQMGISRRISAVPKDFVLGETWVLFAHRKLRSEACMECIKDEMVNPDCPECEGEMVIWKAGIFHAFKPERLEYVVKADDSEEKLGALEARGFTLVKVIRSETPMFDGEIAASAAVN